MRFRGRRHVCANGLVPGMLMSTSRETSEPVRPKNGVEKEIDQTLFPGGYFKEFIFFHKASKTLILADTIINIELDRRMKEEVPI